MMSWSFKLITKKNMETVTMPKHVAEFLYRVYFDFSEDYITAAMKRAYRDLNRTLVNFPKEDGIKEKLRFNWRTFLKRTIEENILKTQFNNWDDFTSWHQSVCEGILTINSEYKGLTIGQAQKWLNMTLKYLYVLGEDRVPGINLNYQYFHMPIDNIIQDAMPTLKKKPNVKTFETWSKIDNYKDYLDFQQKIKQEFKDKIPMNVEFELFNSGLFSKEY